jgi:hypothetical protein
MIVFPTWYVVWACFFLLQAILTPSWLCYLLIKKQRYVRYLEVEIESLQFRLREKERTQPEVGQIPELEHQAQSDALSGGEMIRDDAMPPLPQEETDWHHEPPQVRR